MFRPYKIYVERRSLFLLRDFMHNCVIKVFIDFFFFCTIDNNFLSSERYDIVRIIYFMYVFYASYFYDSHLYNLRAETQ